ncbi:MAG: YbhB/YbcL family Raf kinase inhibitor-like protein [Candidatus Bathyarchaeia archaeon]
MTNTYTLLVMRLAKLRVTSPAFESNGYIPAKYTCDGEDVNPPLKVEGIPAEAKSLVLIVDDPDAPMGTWDHWVVWNIPVTETIKENDVPGIEGMNDFRRRSYGGPCPPSGVHRYFFKVYALDTTLDLPTSSRKRDVERAMERHILAMGELVGLYKRG